MLYDEISVDFRTIMTVRDCAFANVIEALTNACSEAKKEKMESKNYTCGISAASQAITQPRRTFLRVRVTSSV